MNVSTGVTITWKQGPWFIMKCTIKSFVPQFLVANGIDIQNALCNKMKEFDVV